MNNSDWRLQILEGNSETYQSYWPAQVMDMSSDQLTTNLSRLKKRDIQNVQYWGGFRNSLKTLDYKNKNYKNKIHIIHIIITSSVIILVIKTTYNIGNNVVYI